MSGPVPIPTSVALVNRLRDGDKAALGALVERYRPYLVRVARGILTGQSSDLTAEVLQDGALVAVRCWGQFRGKSPGEFLTWLTRIVQRLSIRRRKRDRRQQAVAAEEFDLHPDESAPTPSSEAERHEQAARVLEAMDRLSADYREVLVLRNFQELPFKEVAEQMKRSEVAVRKLWARAVKALGLELGEGDVGEPTT